MKSNIKVLSLFFVLCILITGCMDSSFNKKINIDNINIDMSGFYKKFSTDYLDEEITVVNKDIKIPYTSLQEINEAIGEWCEKSLTDIESF